MLVWTGSIVFEGSPGDVAADLAPRDLPLKEFVPEDNSSLFIFCPYVHG